MDLQGISYRTDCLYPLLLGSTRTGPRRDQGLFKRIGGKGNTDCRSAPARFTFPLGPLCRDRGQHISGICGYEKGGPSRACFTPGPVLRKIGQPLLSIRKRSIPVHGKITGLSVGKESSHDKRNEVLLLVCQVSCGEVHQLRRRKAQGGIYGCKVLSSRDSPFLCLLRGI